MRITEIITERTAISITDSGSTDISRTAKQAVKQHRDANKGAITNFDSKKARKKTRELYGVELVDDFIDVLELPNAEKDTDKQMSMFSKDNR